MLTCRGIFEDLPEMADDIAAKLFTVDGQIDTGLVMYIIESIAKKTSARELVDMITNIMEAF